jgi:hypothetical protein
MKGPGPTIFKVEQSLTREASERLYGRLQGTQNELPEYGYSAPAENVSTPTTTADTANRGTSTATTRHNWAKSPAPSHWSTSGRLSPLNV